MCEWWFTSAVPREDVLRRGRGDLHQQGDADRDAGYSWGTGAIDDEGDRCLDSSYSLGSVKAGIGVTEGAGWEDMCQAVHRNSGRGCPKSRT